MRAIFFSLFTIGTMLAAADSGTNLNNTNLVFEPVHYRPIATKTVGLKKNIVSLDGAWRMDPKPGQDVRETPLNATNWVNFQVPGQWAQQGYDIPRDKTAALAREFTIPAEWAGYRIFLRFDAIHGGTHYWLNGHARPSKQKCSTELGRWHAGWTGRTIRAGRRCR
jgi:beta-galactosidase/beta-glucuronidase